MREECVFIPRVVMLLRLRLDMCSPRDNAWYLSIQLRITGEKSMTTLLTQPENSYFNF